MRLSPLPAVAMRVVPATTAVAPAVVAALIVKKTAPRCSLWVGTVPVAHPKGAERVKRNAAFRKAPDPGERLLSMAVPL